MADKRSGSRQRRTNQNRAARQSLAARRAAAAEKAEQAAQELDEIDQEIYEDEVLDGVPDDEVDDRPTSRPSRTSGRGGRGQGAAAPRERPARRPRPTGPSPVPDHGPGLSGYISGLREVPGGIQVAIGAALSLLVAVAVGLVLKFSPSVVERMGAAAAGRRPPPDQPLTESVGPVILVVVFLPFIAYVVALAFALKPTRRKVWFACALLGLVTSAYAFSPLGLPGILIGGGLLGWGAYKTSKAERV